MTNIQEPLVYYSSNSRFTAEKNSGNAFDANVVFIGDTGEIYTHGRYFGGNVDFTDPDIIDAIINGINGRNGQPGAPGLDGLNYGHASAVNYGVVKIGSGINVSDGVISVDPNAGIEPATTTKLGGIKLGYQQNGKNYPVLLDQNNRAYVAVPWTGSEGGSSTPGSSYDDSWIHGELDNIRTDINTINGKLDAIHNWSEAEVNSAVKNAFNDWTWFKQYADENGLTGTWNINDYDEDLGRWLNAVVNVNDFGGSWSALSQRVDRLEGTVTSLSTGGATPDQVAELLLSSWGISVTDILGLKTAVGKLSTMWADSSDETKALNWMKSGYMSYASQNKSFSQVIADAQSAALNGAIEAATAALTTEVTRIDGRIDSAETTLATKISQLDAEGLISASTSGFYTRAEAETAHAGIYAAIEEAGNTATASVKSSIESYLDESGNKITSAISQMIASSEAGEQSRLASVFVKTSDLGESVAGLVANNNNVKAAVTAIVEGEMSEVLISANNVTIDGNTTVAGKLSALEATVQNIRAEMLSLSDTYEDWHDYGISASASGIKLTDIVDTDNWVSTYIHPGYIEFTTIDNIDIDGYSSWFYGDEVRVPRKFSIHKVSIDEPGVYYTPDRYLETSFETVNGKNLVLIKTSDDVFVDNNVSVNGYFKAGNATLTEDLSVEGGITATSAEFGINANDSGGSVVIDNGISVYGFSNDIRNIDPSVIIDENGILSRAAIKLLYNGQTTATIGAITTSYMDGNNRISRDTVNFDTGISTGLDGETRSYITSDSNGAKFTSEAEKFTFVGDVSVTENFVPNKLSVNDIYTKQNGKIYSVDSAYNMLWDVNNVGFNLSFVNEPYGNGHQFNFLGQDVFTNCEFVSESDGTLKNIVSDTTLTVEQVANAPAVNFTWKSENKGSEQHVGTIAQYWQVVLPEVVKTSASGTLNMNYGNAAMVSSIVTAKEVVALKEEIAELKRQIAELTSK